MAINVTAVKIVCKSVAIVLSGAVALSAIPLLFKKQPPPHYVNLASKSIHLQKQGALGYVVLGNISQ